MIYCMNSGDELKIDEQILVGLIDSVGKMEKMGLHMHIRRAEMAVYT